MGPARSPFSSACLREKLGTGLEGCKGRRQRPEGCLESEGSSSYWGGMSKGGRGPDLRVIKLLLLVPLKTAKGRAHSKPETGRRPPRPAPSELGPLGAAAAGSTGSFLPPRDSKARWGGQREGPLQSLGAWATAHFFPQTSVPQPRLSLVPLPLWC